MKPESVEPGLGAWMAARTARVAFPLHVAFLFAAAVWCRTAQLDTLPAHNPDESYYGLQGTRFLHGERALYRTTSGNLLDPFLALPQGLLTALAGPSIWVLRLPAALSGLLAVALTYGLGARVLGRPAALTASLLLAGLPTAVAHARTGVEFSQSPLVGIVAAYFALRGRRIAFLLAVAAALLVHPTNVFLLPLWLPALVVARLRPLAGRRRSQAAECLRLGLLVAAVAGPYAWIQWKNPHVKAFADMPRDWPTFFDGFGRFLVTLNLPAFPGPLERCRWLFRAGVAALLLLGLPRLLRSGRRDRLAVVFGLGAGLVAFHLLANSQVFDAMGKKYGVVFLVPTALAVGILLDAILPAPADPRRILARFGHRAAPLALGWGALCLTGTMYFGGFPGVRPGPPRVFRTADPFAVTLATILDDHARSGRAGPVLILTQNWDNTWPLEYLASGREGVKVVELITTSDAWRETIRHDGYASKRRRLIEALAGGAYAVGDPGGMPALGAGMIEAAAFPPDRLRRWDVPTVGGFPLTVFHVDRPAGRGPSDAQIAAPGSAPGDALRR